jgi:hypothetical protein
MEQKEEKKQVYEVLIIRYSDDPISLLLTDKYDESYEKWKTTTDIWISSLKDKTPFVITNPIVIAFDPGTVKEILVRPVMKVAESKYENPYQQKMLKNGLGNSLKNGSNILNPDLLDEGYS